MTQSVSLTKLKIIKTATKCFFENGFSKTTPSMICSQLGISPGNLTYHFPTKQHMLAVIIKMLDEFQWNEIQRALDEGVSPLVAFCLELIVMSTASQHSPVASEIYITACTNPMTLEILRVGDTQRAKKVFASYCPDWTDEQFSAAVNVASGIEYATLMRTPDSPPSELMLKTSLDAILSLYNVPEKEREACIEQALSMVDKKITEQFLDHLKDVAYNYVESFDDNFVLKLM